MRFYEPVWEFEGYQLVKRPDTSNYYIYHRLPNRPTRRVSTRTDDLAHARRALIDYAHRRRLPSRPHASEVRVRDTLERYVRTGLAGKSRRDGEHSLQFLEAFLAEHAILTVHELTPAMIREYPTWRQDHARINRPLSTATVNKDLEVLRAALNAHRKEGLVAEVPHVTLLPKPRPRERFLTPDEVERLLDQCCEPHLFRFVMIALHTLQRPGAVLDLRCGQVDLFTRRIDFRPPGWIPSNKRRPVVPITATLVPVLEEAIRESQSGHVIEHQGRPVGRLHKSFQRACQRAELKGVTPYTLRHTGATLLAAAGVPLWQISGMMGHSITRTTEVYAKHAPEFLKDAAAGIERVFGPLSLQRAKGAPGMRAAGVSNAAVTAE